MPLVRRNCRWPSHSTGIKPVRHSRATSDSVVSLPPSRPSTTSCTLDACHLVLLWTPGTRVAAFLRCGCMFRAGICRVIVGTPQRTPPTLASDSSACVPPRVLWVCPHLFCVLRVVFRFVAEAIPCVRFNFQGCTRVPVSASSLLDAQQIDVQCNIFAGLRH